MNGFKWTLLTLTSCFFPRVPLPPSIFAASFRRSFEIRMEKSVVVAKIKCGRDVVDLKIYPADFQFLDFNRWLQNRFPICADAKLIFRDNHGDGTYEGIATLNHINIAINFSCVS